MPYFFKNRWHNRSTVMARSFNSRWNDYSTVTGIKIQHSLSWFFNSHWHSCSRLDCLYFFCAGTVFQQQYSMLKNRVMYQEYDTRSGFTLLACNLSCIFLCHHYPEQIQHRHFMYKLRKNKIISSYLLMMYFETVQNTKLMYALWKRVFNLTSCLY